MAAVMSTTDALLLACSAAITHDLLGQRLQRSSERTRRTVTIAVPWAIGLFAMVCAWSPPQLITAFYSAAVGLLVAGPARPAEDGVWLGLDAPLDGALVTRPVPWVAVTGRAGAHLGA